jgi:TolA-binding protein
MDFMKKLFLLLVFSGLIFGQDSRLISEGIELFQKRQYAEAYKVLSEINAQSNVDEQKITEAVYYSALCLIQLNQIDGASPILENFLNQYPHSNFRSAAHYQLGIIYFEKKEFRKQRDRLRQLLSEYQFSEFTGSSLYLIGESFYAENKFIDAEESFRDALANKRTNKYYVNTLYSLGLTYENLRDYSSAVNQYDEILTYYNENYLARRAQFRIGVCYYSLKDYDNAIIELNDPLISELTEEDMTEAKFFLANSYVKLREYSQGKKVYSELIERLNSSAGTAKIKYALAWIDFQLGNYEEAYTNFSEVHNIASDSLKVSALFWSGECKRYLGDVESSNKIFNNFIELYPDHNFASRAQLSIGSMKLNNQNSNNSESALQNALNSRDAVTKVRAAVMLGEIRLSQKKYIEAKDYFVEYDKIRIDDRQLKNRLKLGEAISLFYLNNYSNSEKILELLRSDSKSFEPDKVMFYLAETYFMLGKYSAALRQYNSIKTSDENITRQSQIGRAYTLFNLKDYVNSSIAFKDYLLLYPRDPQSGELKLRLADSYYGMKNFDKAAEVYRDIFSNERLIQTNDAAFYQYAQSLFKAGNSNEALNKFVELQRKFPRSSYVDDAQYVIGWINFQQNNFRGAINNYIELLDKYPTSNLKPIAYYSIGDAYFNLAEYDSSIIFYTKVIAEYSNTQFIFDAVNGIQYSYVAKDEPQKAIAFIDQFIQSNPGSKFTDQIHFKKGDLSYSIGDYQTSYSAFKEFIQLFPSSPLVSTAYFWIGKSAGNLKRNDEALANFKRSRELNPKSDIGISSTIELANLYISKKEFSQAVNVLRETAALVPTSNRIPELLFLLGGSEVKNGNYSQALSTFDQIITYYDGNVFSSKAKIEAGKIELFNKNYNKADEYFREVAEKRTDDIGAEAQYQLGILLYEQNKIQEAITSFVRVRSVYAGYDEWYTNSLLRLGDCYVKIKDKKLAREMYRAVLTRHTSGPFADEAKRKINKL